MKYLTIMSMFFLAGFVLLSVSPVLADTEPNNSLMEPEIVGEGTVSGTVSMNLTTAADIDYYKISVPADKDIVVTMKKTDSGNGAITITSYDHLRNEMYFIGIHGVLTEPGEMEEDSDWNSENIAQNIYLEVSGEGDYELTIEFTDDSSEAVEGFLQACCLGTVGIILIPIVVIVGIIILIIVIVKIMGKKKKQQ